jgi:hypothetical protein
MTSRDELTAGRDRLPPVAQHDLVGVDGVEGGRVATNTAAVRAEALDAYLRPFARPDVPEIFSEAAPLRE